MSKKISQPLLFNYSTDNRSDTILDSFSMLYDTYKWYEEPDGASSTQVHMCVSACVCACVRAACVRARKHKFFFFIFEFNIKKKWPYMLFIFWFEAYLWVTVGDRTWVRIRKSAISYSNPSTVTYGHPENKEYTLILLFLLDLYNDIKPLTVIK